MKTAFGISIISLFLLFVGCGSPNASPSALTPTTSIPVTEQNPASSMPIQVPSSTPTVTSTPLPTATVIPTPAPTATPDLPPIPSGLGGLIVASSFLPELQLSIGGQLYRIPAKTRHFIYLPPGRQAYTAIAPGGPKRTGAIDVLVNQYLLVTFGD